MELTLLTKDQVGDIGFRISQRGRLNEVTYDKIVAAFGEPTFTPEDQLEQGINYQWVFKQVEDYYVIYDLGVDAEYARNTMGNSNEKLFCVASKKPCVNFIQYIESNC